MRRMFSEKQLENQTIDLLGEGNVPSIKADSIIENMSGYSASIGTATNWLIENVYTSVVKTGNKITFVTCVDVTKLSDDANAQIKLCSFTIPLSLGERLYETQIGSYSWLDVRKGFAASTYNSGKDINLLVDKESNVLISFFGDGMSALTKDVKYNVRYEVTFLLSNNLID